MKKKKRNGQKIIRTIYLYLFTIIGLVLLTIGSVGLVDLALKNFIFTDADNDYYRAMPPTPYGLEKVREIQTNENLTEQQLEDIDRWLVDYNTWSEANEKDDYKKSQNQRDAARNIALILVGLPLYLFHWNIIKRETKS